MAGWMKDGRGPESPDSEGPEPVSEPPSRESAPSADSPTPSYEDRRGEAGDVPPHPSREVRPEEDGGPSPGPAQRREGDDPGPELESPEGEGSRPPSHDGPREGEEDASATPAPREKKKAGRPKRHRPSSESRIRPLLVFLSWEVLGKTLLLCLLATLVTHILLQVNPTVGSGRTRQPLSAFLPDTEQNADERRLAVFIARDVHTYWMGSAQREADLQQRAVFRHVLRQDLAEAAQRDPTVVLPAQRAPFGVFGNYFLWVRDVFEGGLGFSAQGQSIAVELRARLPTTVILALGSLILTVALALYGSLVFTLRQHWWLAKAQDFTFYAVSALPAFIVGYACLRFFGVGGVGADNLLLPMLVLTISNGTLAELLVVMKGSFGTSMKRNYAVFARSKGLSELQVLWRHAFRNALINILPNISRKMAFVVSGTIVVEKVFSLSGLADMLLDGLGNHDESRVLVVILVATALVRIGSLSADTLLYVLDPRATQRALA